MAKTKPKTYRKHNWRAIRDLYITGEMSLRALARRFNVDPGQISIKSRKEAWEKRRKVHQDRISAKFQQKSALETLDRLERNKKLVLHGIGTVLAGIKKGTVKPSLADLDRLIRLDEFLHGNKPPGEGETLEELFARLTKIRIQEHKEALKLERPTLQLPVIDAKVVDDDGTDKQ